MWRALTIGMLVSFTTCAVAQDDRPASVTVRPRTSTSSLSTTPEMWLYQQEQARHDNPKQAVRRKAELRCAERQNRIESMKWYGLSNSRPIATPTPWFGAYLPGWASNSSDPQRWRPQVPVRVAEQPRSAY